MVTTNDLDFWLKFIVYPSDKAFKDFKGIAFRK